jgi:hypothetical protein
VQVELKQSKVAELKAELAGKEQAVVYKFSQLEQSQTEKLSQMGREAEAMRAETKNFETQVRPPRHTFRGLVHKRCTHQRAHIMTIY